MSTADKWATVRQADVKLQPSEPCMLDAAAIDAAIAAAAALSSTTAVTYPLLPALAAHPQMQLFRPYLVSLPEEDQIAIALRLEMEHMRDVYLLDRTIGYRNWAAAHPEEHQRIRAAKSPTHAPIVLPPQLDTILDMLPRES